MAGATTSRRILDSAARPRPCGAVLSIATCVLVILLLSLSHSRQQPARPRALEGDHMQQPLGAAEHAARLQPGRHGHAAGVLRPPSCPAWDPRSAASQATHRATTGRATTTSTCSRPDANSTTTGWHPARLANADLVPVASLQPGRIEVVRHPRLLGAAPVLAKLADGAAGAHEATVYRLLYDLGVTPRFLGHVTAGAEGEEEEDPRMGGTIIGFVTEYVEPSTGEAEPVPEHAGAGAEAGAGAGAAAGDRGPEKKKKEKTRQEACLAALRRMHARGIAHGDAHGGNCLLRADGTAALIDFELSKVAGSRADFDRDLWIMSHTVDD